LVGQPAGLGLPLEPGPALGVGGGPGETPVALGVGMATKGVQLAPHLVKGGPGRSSTRARRRGISPRRTVPAELAHVASPSRIGTRTSRSSATDSAISYPASTCRITPI